MSYKTRMNEGGESSGGIVPAKRSKESLGRLHEIVEGRPLAKENTGQSNPHRTLCRTSGQTMAEPGTGGRVLPG